MVQVNIVSVFSLSMYFQDKMKSNLDETSFW